MTPDYKSYSDHYFDIKHHPVAFFANHDMRMELILWQQLHQAGLIQLYMHKWSHVNRKLSAHELPAWERDNGTTLPVLS